MRVIKTNIEGLLIIEPEIFVDIRGYFFESFNEKRYRESGIPYSFVQDNCSRSSQGVLRGLHFQKTKPQGKLVSVISGVVLDVAVDLRPKSNTFGFHKAVVLSSENKRQFFVPPGFAHGFFVMSEMAEFNYKCTNYYDPNDEAGILWNDRELAIDWKVKNPLLSEKDKNLMTFSEYRKSILN